ncbi:MAG: response regulator [Anaerolineae bacterium]|nr:response regulator [Anaerolineae bacterium]
MAKILVIEDEANLREDVVELLTLEGHHVISACDGVEGINSAIQNQPDLIICDIMMPRLDGYEVLLDIRANSLTQFVPFIFLTAKAARDDLRTGMELGADDYITKPFTRVDLLRAIEKRLDLKSAQEQEHQEQLAEFKSALAQERGQRLLTERLIAMFSSDFRNPISGILDSTQLLSKYSDRVNEERRAAHMKRIEMSASFLLQMLDDMLVIARLENGSLRYTPESVDVGVFVGRIVDEFQIVHEETHPLQYDCQFSGCLETDPQLLRQIVVNLLKTAVKDSVSGKQVHVGLNSGDRECVLTVQYTGSGSAPAEAPLSLVDDGMEAGLGLAIVDRAVEMCGSLLQIDKLPDNVVKASVIFPTR